MGACGDKTKPNERKHMPDMPNLRTMKVTTGSGKDQEDTGMLKGEAKTTPAETCTNSTVQYTTSGDTKNGALGGEAKQN